MNYSNRVAAFGAYLLPILGWLYVFIFRRQDKLAVFHTKQAIIIALVMIIAPLLWAVSGWLVSLIPFVGFILAVAAFTLVIALYIALAVSWLTGMVYAAQGQMKPVPLVGTWLEHPPLISARARPAVYTDFSMPVSTRPRPPSFAGDVGEQTVQVIGFGRRLAAAFIDGFLLLAANFTLALLIAILFWFVMSFEQSTNFNFVVLFLLLAILLSAIYYIGSWAKSGQTIGKSILNIKVVSTDGSPLSVGKAALRYVGYFVNSLIFSLGFIWISFDPKRQGWHDKIAKTYVISIDDDFSTAGPVTFVQSDAGQGRLWPIVWLVVALITPMGTLSSFWLYGPVINRLIENFLQGLR